MIVDAVEDEIAVLDGIDESVLILCWIYADEKPPRGLASLVDWRTGGALSKAFVADDSMSDPGSVRRLESAALAGAQLLVVGGGVGPVEAALNRSSVALDDALDHLEAKPYRVLTSWPSRLAEEDNAAERWLAPLLKHFSTARLCLVGSAARLDAIRGLVLRAERRLVGKSEPFSFPIVFIGGNDAGGTRDGSP